MDPSDPWHPSKGVLTNRPLVRVSPRLIASGMCALSWPLALGLGVFGKGPLPYLQTLVVFCTVHASLAVTRRSFPEAKWISANALFVPLVASMAALLGDGWDGAALRVRLGGVGMALTGVGAFYVVAFVASFWKRWVDA
jgi:hypothetical protein